MILLTGWIPWFCGGGDGARLLRCDDLHVAGASRSIPRAFHGVRIQRTAGLNYTVDLTQHARKADAHVRRHRLN